jgi:hypothetical protein
VALPTDQRSVADCPRSMVRGSAVKLLIRTASAGAGGGSDGGFGVGAGGGAVAIGVFFLQPDTDISSTVANIAALSVLIS